MSDGVPDATLGAADRRWDRLAREQQFVQLRQVRESAEKWRNALTALTGLLAVVLTVTAPLTSKALPDDWRYGVGALQLLALVLLSLGALNAMRAAFGEPASIRDNGVRLRQWNAKATTDAVGQLRCARGLTVSGFVVLALAATAAFVAPAAGVAVRVVPEQGEAYCGSGKTSDDGTKITVRGENGAERVFEVAAAESIKILKDGC